MFETNNPPSLGIPVYFALTVCELSQAAGRQLMFESKALEVLGAFPLVQAAVAILVVLAGIYLMRRGEKDKKVSSIEPVPQC